MNHSLSPSVSICLLPVCPRQLATGCELSVRLPFAQAIPPRSTPRTKSRISGETVLKIIVAPELEYYQFNGSQFNEFSFSINCGKVSEFENRMVWQVRCHQNADLPFQVRFRQLTNVMTLYYLQSQLRHRSLGSDILLAVATTNVS